MKRVLIGSALAAMFATIHCVGPPKGCKTDGDCSPLDYCEKTLGGGSCVALYEAIAIRHPATGTVLDGGPQTLDVELIGYPGLTRRDPASVSYSIRASAGTGILVEGELPSAGAGHYQTSWTPGPEGSYELSVSFHSLSAASQFTIDRSAPAFSVQIPAPPLGSRPAGTNLITRDIEPYSDAWRRDEILPVEVRANSNDVDTSSVNVVIFGISSDGGVGRSQPTVIPVAVTPCDAGYCGLAQLPLWEPQMQAFRGNMFVRVVGHDRVGNDAEAAAWAKVTRWKWDYDTVSPTGMTSPAIGPTGRIYFGPANAARIHALDPSGAEIWPSGRGGIPSPASSVAVATLGDGSDIIFTGTIHSATGKLAVLRGADGTQLRTCGLGNTQASIVLTRTTSGQPLPEAMALQNPGGSVNRTVVWYNAPGSSFECSLFGSNWPQAAQSSSIVVKGSNFYYRGDASNIWGYQLGSTNPSQAAPGWPVYVPGLRWHTLAISGAEIIGGGSTGPDAGVVFAIPNIGGTFWRLDLTSEAWNPAIRGTSQILVGLTNDSVQSVTTRDSASASTAPISGIVKGTPIVARGNLLYVASGSYVHALDATDLTSHWQYRVASSDVEASLAIDCLRDAAGQAIGGRPLGVLYVPSMNGHLYAFIIDSAGLDTTSAWPKYQHDPPNSGNADTDLSLFACP